MSLAVLTSEQISSYRQEGYLLLPNFFAAGVIDQLRVTANADKILDEASFGRADGEGGTVRLSLWNHPTDTIYGAIARSRSMVEADSNSATTSAITNAMTSSRMPSQT